MLKKIVSNLSTATKETNKLVKELYVKPKKEKGINQAPTFQVYQDGIYQQSDLLFLPEDNSLDKKEKQFWIPADITKVKAIERNLFNNIRRSFFDTDDKINYVITDVVKPSKISKVKKSFYYKYYDKDKYGVNVPLNENDFEYTDCDLLLNAKWLKWKARLKDLIIPETKTKSGYRYALVCVDIHSRKCDAAPLRDKTSDSIIEGYHEIYTRKILKIPKVMHVDSGTEFKGEVANYLTNKLGIKVRVADVQRHRQQAIVERKNQLIGAIIAQLQGEKELDTRSVNTEWVELLPSIIKEINENLPKPITTQPSNFPYSDKTNEDLIPMGSMVRVALNHPINIHNEKTLSGRFRDSDIKWSPQKYPVTEILLKPSQPPMYLTTHDKSQHTRQQLHFV